MKGSIGLCLSAVVALSSWTLGCGDPDDEDDCVGGSGRTYYFVTHGFREDTFWKVFRRGVDDAAARYGVNTVYLGSDDFNEAQVAANFDEAMAETPDGIAVTMTEDGTDANQLGVSLLAAKVNAAAGSGMPIIAVNASGPVPAGEIKSANYLLYVGQKDYEAGKIGAFRMRDVATSKGFALTRVICVKHVPADVLTKRCSGMQDALNELGLGITVEVVSWHIEGEEPVDVPNTGDEAKQDLLDNYINAAKGLERFGIMGTGPLGVPSILAAINEAGVDPKKTVFGTFDVGEDTLDALQNGTMDFAIDQQQYLQGYLPIPIFENYLDYKLLPGDDVLTGPGFVDPSNAADVQDLIQDGVR